MLVENLLYDVREALKQYSDDSELDNRYILYLYNIKRAKYLRQDLNSFQKTVDQSITQTFCIGLEEVDLDQCGLNYACGTLLRTKTVIPRPIDLHTKTAITKVKPTSRLALSFNFITKDKAQFLDASPFVNAVYAFLDDDNYIYVYSNMESFKLIECITVSGVFQDPIELSNYSNCCNCKITAETTCFDLATTNYPLQPHYVDLIKSEIVNELASLKQIPEDRENDATDNG